MLFAQISNFMSNGDLALTLLIAATPFLLIAACGRWPLVMTIVIGAAFIYFVGIPIILFCMIAYAGAKGKR